MSKLYDNIIDYNGLMIKLRMDNEFDENEYEKIKNALIEIIPEWKRTGKVDVEDLSGLLDLIRFLAGGSRFWSEEVALRAEDAELELTDIIHENLRL
jgi:hypothetical protein